MNPFEEDNDNSKNVRLNIEIWLEQHGRKKVTYISGWNIPEDMMKEHLKTIKKTNACSASFNKETKIVQMQGDHVQYISKYLAEHDITQDCITIKG